MKSAIQTQVPLAPLTSFQVGGVAEQYLEAPNTQSLLETLAALEPTPKWILGYGSNALVSDQGLSELVLSLRGGDIQIHNNQLVVDAGVWWDDVVNHAASHHLWGIELLSGVPGNVGAAIFINIAAYGQSLGPLLDWVEAWDPQTRLVKRFTRDDFHWDYKQSIFQQPEHRALIIVRAALALSQTQTAPLVYQKAVNVAKEIGADPKSLSGLRQIILEARQRAGSLWQPGQQDARTVGSFFRNPVVPEALAERILNHEETDDITPAQLKKINQVHGGNPQRVSAALVMLAADFSRGQQWGQVKLNDQNLLKIEALPGATAQAIYNVARHIQTVCDKKLGIELKAEACMLGTFDQPNTPVETAKPLPKPKK